MARKFDINSPMLHVVMYAILLFFTPFILLRSYLQDAIGRASTASFEVFGVSIPYVLVAAGVVFAILILRFGRYLTLRRVVAFAVVVLLWLLGQKTADYYFGHRFYELQHNWHYIAYALFVLVIYRACLARKTGDARFALWAFLLPLGVSTLDEVFQFFISSRVFDIGDIAKDTWGAVIGIVFVFFVIKSGKIVEKGWKLRNAKPAEYIRNPLSITLLSAIFAYSLLFFGSILTEVRYIGPAIGISLGIFVLIFLVIHLSQMKAYRILFSAILVMAILAQGTAFAVYHDDYIVKSSESITIYKGVPIPYFDVMIYPNGCFRLVDKKEAFNQRDMLFFYEHAESILLIAGGFDGAGGMGFPKEWESQFIFNPQTGKGLQVIIQSTPTACKTFNRLKEEGKDVLFVVHST